MKNYAYERQGSAAAYSKIALKCVSIRYENGNKWSVPSKKDAKDLWKSYKDIARENFNLIDGDKKTGNERAMVNGLRNPMNEDKGVIDKMASNNIPNIAIYIRDLVSDGNTNQAYNFIKSIRGIGEKISSFYLRDIICLTKLEEKNIPDLYLLQPLDTWLEQTLKILFTDVPKKLSEKQKLIVDLCKESRISSISFNQGAWVLGSQIAGEFETFKRALIDYDFAQKIIEHRIKEREEYLREVKKVLDGLRHTPHNSE